MSMRPNKVYLKQLNTSSRNYRVKVRVIEKGRPKCSSKTGTPYQNLLLEDDEGSRMRGVLFGEQVEGFKNVLMYNGQYQIANAPIKPCEDQWKVSASDLNFQMYFGKPAIVEQSETNEGPLVPQYRNIAQIPKAADPADRFDIVAVVVFVEEKPRRIVRDHDRVTAVREIAVIDHSTEQPLIISAWNDLAEEPCDLLRQKAEQLQVVGFTALKVSPHKGFSMTTTMSTTIVHSATGDKPRALEDWVASNIAKVSEIQARILTMKGLFGHEQTTTIATLRMKKAQTTLQDERYTLQVTVPEPDFQKINAYLGCSNCSKRTDTVAGDSFTCTHCSKSGSKSIPRITFHCDVSDGTGTLPIIAFTADVEKIIRSLAPDIFRMKHSEDLVRFEALKSRLQTLRFKIEVGPNTTLSMNNVLHWVLKKVITLTDAHPESLRTEPEVNDIRTSDKTVATADNSAQGNTSTEISQESISIKKKSITTESEKNSDKLAVTEHSTQVPKLISVKVEGCKPTPTKKGPQSTATPSQKDMSVNQKTGTSDP